MKKTKIVQTGIVLLLLSAVLTVAHGAETFDKAEQLLKQKKSCDALTPEELEVMGEYYMEQMHPGEAHEQMDAMMGGEGSARLKNMHERMGRAFYCGEHEMMSPEMRGMMMDTSKGGEHMMGTNMGGMMFGSMRVNWFANILLASTIFGAIFWLMYKLIIGERRKT